MSSEPKQPYREDPLRDTGRNPKIPHEGKHMSNARMFDTLVASNMALVKTIRTGIYAVGFCILVMGAMQIYTNASLRSGQRETRELIIAINRNNCSEGAATTNGKATR